MVTLRAGVDYPGVQHGIMLVKDYTGEIAYSALTFNEDWVVFTPEGLAYRRIINTAN